MRLFDPAEQSESTVSQILDQYLDHRRAQAQAGRFSPESLDRAERYCRLFARSFGPLIISDCRKTDLDDFLTAHPEWESPHTLHDAVGAIITAFRWAEDAQLVDKCPYSKPKDLPTPEPRLPITASEVKAILKAAKQYAQGGGKAKGKRPTSLRFRLAVWFLWETGCRTCEMFNLKWEQYDDEKGVFTLPSKTTRKTGKPRLLVLPKRAWRMIRWMRRIVRVGVTPTGTAETLFMPPIEASFALPPREVRTTGHVFLNGRGRPWCRNRFQARFRENVRRAGVRTEMTAYCLRHGFCVKALEGGAGERQLADFMGHASTRYINWYGRGARGNVDYLRETGEKGREK
jgi:integrase